MGRQQGSAFETVQGKHEHELVGLAQRTVTDSCNPRHAS